MELRNLRGERSEAKRNTHTETALKGSLPETGSRTLTSTRGERGRGGRPRLRAAVLRGRPRPGRHEGAQTGQHGTRRRDGEPWGCRETKMAPAGTL